MRDRHGDDYFFGHVLTQQAAYGALLQHNRRTIHGLAADVMQQSLQPGLGSDWMLLPEVARHQAAAGRMSEAHATWCHLLFLAASMGNHTAWAEWERDAEQTWRELHGKAETPPPSAALELARAEAIYKRFDYERARPAYEQAYRLAVEAGDESGQALCLSRMGFLMAHGGQLDTADDCLRRAIGINERLANQQNLAGSLVSLGFFTMRYQQNPAEAEQLYMRALGIARESGSLVLEAMLMNNLGILYHEYQGRMQDALACYEFALAANRAYGNVAGEAIAADNLGGLLFSLGRLEEAKPILELSVQRYADAKDTPGVGSSSSKLGLVLLRKGEAQAARPHLERALNILEALDEPYWLAFTYTHWGEYELAGGSPAAAQGWFEKAMQLAEEQGEPLLQAECHLGLARTALAAGEWAEAARLLDAAQAANTAQQYVGGMLAEKLLRAELALQMAVAHGANPGALQAIERYLDEARAILDEQHIEHHGPDGQLLEALARRLADLLRTGQG